MDAPRLLDIVRQTCRRKHYSPRTEQAYLYWIRKFIRHNLPHHPRELGESEITAYLNYLATDRKVAASTQNQALSALLFLYKEILKVDLAWLENVVRAKRPKRLPVVLTRTEVRQLLEQLTNYTWLMASLLYGAGLRLNECVQLRVKDVDFGYGQITVRAGKGNKDRITLLPRHLETPLRRHLANVKTLHERDLEAGFGRVALPNNLKKKEQLQEEYDLLKTDIYDPAKMADRRYYSKISRRFKLLEEILNYWQEIKAFEKTISDNTELIEAKNDSELKEMAREEIEETELAKSEKVEILKQLLAPRDPNDDKDAIVEIRAGTGGDEAALFVADLYRMYSYLAEKKGWKKTIISSNETGVGGLKEIIFSLSGTNVFGTMRFESGVHRVQRVPATESQGRIHTSAISVAVLPEADDVEVEIDPNDLKIDVYRSSGHGGQSVNTTDSAVRITHLPTGLVVICQDEKSQLKNKSKAMKVLRSRMLDLEISKQEAEISAARKSQVGTGDRSAKIRTYNFPQSRVTDHRINLTSFKLNNILLGDLDEFIGALKIAYKNEMMNG